MKLHGQSQMQPQVKKACAFTNQKTLTLLAGVLAALLALPPGAQAQEGAPNPGQAPLTGRWITASGNLEVQISPCNQALCGTVVRVLANRSMSNPNVDMGPADPKVLGMKILTDFTPSGDGEWKGQIYNRENGKTYSCLMSLAAADQLKVRPYVGVSLFGQTQIWRRPADQTGQK